MEKDEAAVILNRMLHDEDLCLRADEPEAVRVALAAITDLGTARADLTEIADLLDGVFEPTTSTDPGDMTFVEQAYRRAKGLPIPVFEERCESCGVAVHPGVRTIHNWNFYHEGCVLYKEPEAQDDTEEDD